VFSHGKNQWFLELFNHLTTGEFHGAPPQTLKLGEQSENLHAKKFNSKIIYRFIHVGMSLQIEYGALYFSIHL